MKNKNLKTSRFPLADNDNRCRINEVSVQLIKLVVNMAETERIELLDKLEKRHLSKYMERRKHPRKRVFIYVNCSIHSHIFANYIHNISCSGLFIETESQIPFTTGQNLTMGFTPPNSGNPAIIRGNIVRVDSKGVAIKFDDPIPHI